MKSLVLLLLVFSTQAWAVPYEPSSGPNAFAASTPAFVPPATPTDMCQIYGSATKTIRVTSVEVSSNQSTAGVNPFYFIKRSAANTGGTAFTMTNVQLDSGKAAGTAVVKFYAANPTGLGTAVGTLFTRRAITAASTSLQVPYFEWLLPSSNVFQPVTLRGVSEGLAVNFGGAPLPTGLTVNCVFRWIEE